MLTHAQCNLNPGGLFLSESNGAVEWQENATS